MTSFTSDRFAEPLIPAPRPAWERDFGIVIAYVRINIVDGDLDVFGDPYDHMHVLYPGTKGRQWEVKPHFKVGPVTDFSGLRPVGVYGILADTEDTEGLDRIGWSL